MKDCAAKPSCPYTARPGGRHCYWHAKVRDGLICTCDPKSLKDNDCGCAAAKQPRPRDRVLASGVLDNEQTELVALLDTIGASPLQTRAALRREDRIRVAREAVSW